MNEHIQYILALLIVAAAAGYTVVALIRLFTRKSQDGCTSHGCPSCGIKNELKKSYARKVKAGSSMGAGSAGLKC